MNEKDLENREKNQYFADRLKNKQNSIYEDSESDFSGTGHT